MTQLRADVVVLDGGTLSLWRSWSIFLKEWSFDNHVYWTKDVDFEVRLRQHLERCCRLFVGWLKTELLIVWLARRGKISILVFGRWSQYDATWLSDDQTPTMFSYPTVIYINCRDAERLVEMIARREDTSINMACFFAACRHGSFSPRWRILSTIIAAPA